MNDRAENNTATGPAQETVEKPQSRLRAAAEVIAQIPRNAYNSFVRIGYPTEVRQRLAMIVNNWFLHIHSTRVHPYSLLPQFTLGLGLLNLFLFFILLVTGIWLMFYYVPSPDEAYGRMQDFLNVVTFGRVMRNLHRWAAHAMVIAVVLHTCRVFYTAAYKPPREFNWVIGVVLLILTLALSFTGYLLPWDQLSFWAITVGANIIGYAPVLGAKFRLLLLGSDTVGGEALLRFYVLHVALLPTVAAVFIGYHFWRIRKDGGLARPQLKTSGLLKKPEAEETIPSFPRVLYLEVLFLLLTTALLLLVSLYWNAPLEPIADPNQPPNPSKAPWYFLGVQELVSYSAFWGGVVLPTLFVMGLLLLPYLDRDPRGVGVWFAKERMFVMIIWSLVWLVTIIFTVIGVYFRGPIWNFYWPWQNWPGP